MLSVSLVLSVSVETDIECGTRCVFERHNHRFVVDCGKRSVVAIFLLPMPAAGAERTISHAKYLQTFRDLRQMTLWRMDWCHESVMYVGDHTFYSRKHSSSRWA